MIVSHLRRPEVEVAIHDRPSSVNPSGTPLARTAPEAQRTKDYSPHAKRELHGCQPYSLYNLSARAS